MKTAACSTCQAEIIWGWTVAGKKMPVAAQPSETGNVWLEESADGSVTAHVLGMKAIAALGVERYQSHFASCRQAGHASDDEVIRRVIGADPSFSGFGLADHDRAIAVAATGETLRERCRSLYVAFAHFVEAFADEPMLWIVEQPMLSERNLQHLLNMGHLMSHVYDLAESLADVDVVEVHAGRLKIFAAGRGNANKTELAVSVFERWGMRFDGDGGGNKCDAFALYKFGVALINGENPGVRPPKPKRRKASAAWNVGSSTSRLWCGEKSCESTTPSRAYRSRSRRNSP